jgi:hypothetical protein
LVCGPNGSLPLSAVQRAEASGSERSGGEGGCDATSDEERGVAGLVTLARGHLVEVGLREDVVRPVLELDQLVGQDDRNPPSSRKARFSFFF